MISAGLSPAWRLLGGVIPPQLDAAALRAWSQPGWIKVGMEFRLQPIPLGTLLSTETRVLATDPGHGGLHGLLVVHPRGQWRNSSQGIEDRRAPRGVSPQRALTRQEPEL